MTEKIKIDFHCIYCSWCQWHNNRMTWFTTDSFNGLFKYSLQKKKLIRNLKWRYTPAQSKLNQVLHSTQHIHSVSFSSPHFGHSASLSLSSLHILLNFKHFYQSSSIFIVFFSSSLYFSFTFEHFFLPFCLFFSSALCSFFFPFFDSLFQSSLSLSPVLSAFFLKFDQNTFISDTHSLSITHPCFFGGLYIWLRLHKLEFHLKPQNLYTTSQTGMWLAIVCQICWKIQNYFYIGYFSAARWQRLCRMEWYIRMIASKPSNHALPAVPCLNGWLYCPVNNQECNSHDVISCQFKSHCRWCTEVQNPHYLQNCMVFGNECMPAYFQQIRLVLFVKTSLDGEILQSLRSRGNTQQAQGDYYNPPPMLRLNISLY